MQYYVLDPLTSKVLVKNSIEEVLLEMERILHAKSGATRAEWQNQALDLGYNNDDYGFYQSMTEGGVRSGIMRGNKPIECDIFIETKYAGIEEHGN